MAKEKSLVAAERERPDVVARRTELHKVRSEPPKMVLPALDPTGANRSMTKRQAWAPIGVRAVDHVPANKGKNVTLVGAIRLGGPVVMRTMLEGQKKTLLLTLSVSVWLQS